MDVEYAAFIQRETWTLVPRPLDANVVSCKWVYSLKYNPDGSIARYKARLVARGFSQAYGLDYHETFSLVARLSSIRVLFSLALDQYWPLHQLDVSNAFLYRDLDEQVFMEQPPGYVAQGESSEVCLDVSFSCVVKHKDDGQTKFIKPNSQIQDIIIKYWVSIRSIHREQG